MATVVGTAATTGSNNIYLGGEPLIALGPEHAATVASRGWKKDDFRRAVWDAAAVPRGRFTSENLARFEAIYPEGFADRTSAAVLRISRDWRDIMVIVTGGAGKHSAFIPTFGATRSVTQKIAE